MREEPVEVIKEVEIAREVALIALNFLPSTGASVPLCRAGQVPVITVREVPVYIDREMLAEERVEVPVDVVREVRPRSTPCGLVELHDRAANGQVAKEVPVQLIKEVPVEVARESLPRLLNKPIDQIPAGSAPFEVVS